MNDQYTTTSADETLMQGCIEGNRLAQKYLYQRYYGQYMVVPLRYLNNREDALGVLNQAFLKIFNSLESFKGDGPLAAWMGKIVLHTTLDHVRSQKTYRQKIHFPTEPEEQPIENEAMNNLVAEELLTLLQKLPDTARAVFSLYVIDGFKHREIAEQLGIEENTSKWYLSQARQLLQDMLHQQKTSQAL